VRIGILLRGEVKEIIDDGVELEVFDNPIGYYALC
jgi:hypothetical protein